MRMWFVPWFFVGLAVTALSCAASASSVATAPVSRIKLDTPALAPMAYTRFCLAYADACKERSRRSIKIMPWTATPYRWVRIQSPTETKLWARVAN